MMLGTSEISHRRVYPQNLYVEVTDRCNLKCMICHREEYEEYINSPGQFLDIANIGKLAPAIAQAETLTINGFGETMLHPQLKQLLDQIYALNPKDGLIRLVTNGTALRKETASWFSGHLDWIQVSLNAGTAEAYAREMHPYQFKAGRDYRFAFERLLGRLRGFLEGLREDERHKIRLSFVAHRDNIDEFDEFVRVAARLGISTVTITHFTVQRQRNLRKSLWWLRDDYNRRVEEAMALGASLGVTVHARRFYTEPKRVAAAEEVCSWPNDSAIVTVGGLVVPCCYWLGLRNELSNVFEASGQTFDEVWFGKFFEGLRAKRDHESCRNCLILQTFDDISAHFGVFLKTFEKEETAPAEDPDLTKLVTYFADLGADLPRCRHTLLALGLDPELLAGVAAGTTTLEEVDRLCWETYCKLDAPKEVHDVRIPLGGQFLGIGWGPANFVPSLRQSWRWLGRHGGWSTLLLRVPTGRHYLLRLVVHTTNDHSDIDGLRLQVNGVPPEERWVVYEDGVCTVRAVVHAETVDSQDGRLRIAIAAGPCSVERTGGWALGLASLSLEELSLAAWRDMHLERLGLCSVLHRHAFGRLGIDLPVYLKETTALKAVRVLEAVAQARIREVPEMPATPSELALAEPFIGTGWGPPHSDSMGQRWRWLGQHGAASSVFAQVPVGRGYDVYFRVHTAHDQGELLSLRATVNGILPTEQWVECRDGPFELHVVVPAEIVDTYDGRLWFALSSRQHGATSAGYSLGLSRMFIRARPGAPADPPPDKEGMVAAPAANATTSAPAAATP
jgi:molybdenum cofactor biosynthesis enzyme MoaA